MQRNFLETLDNEVNKRLSDHGIYDVTSYGWQDEETPSDEFVGLAMWTTDAPYHALYSWQKGDHSDALKPSDEALHASGEDFVGTMELARHSLGLAIYCFESWDPTNILDDEQFWEYQATTAIWLNIASDRIRDYFVAARFEITPAKFTVENPARKRYADPFKMHQRNESELVKKCARRALPLTQRLGKLRKLRNVIVHEVASRKGARALETLRLRRAQAQCAQILQPATNEIVLHIKDAGAAWGGD